VYIGKLRLHTEQLARQNNKLAAYHKEVTSKVMTLMGIDLLRQRSKWKEGIKDIRQIISK
jgi:dynein heavy chain 2